ncbi:hypothetical protein HN937_22765 [Candidatus Poribacteria bacterium]|mgnify:FL=1|nr:hypothetical protein [Candidatus Poribacteria bacterium]
MSVLKTSSLSLAPHWRSAAREPFLSALLACCALSAGCGEEPSDDVRPEPAYVIDVRPTPGATICPDGKVIVVFNRDPGPVRCEGGRLDPDGQTGSLRTFRMDWGPSISFAWPDDGSLTVAYSRLTCGEGGAATLVAVTPDEGGPVSAQVLQANGIVLDFDEPVTPAAAGTRGAFRVVDSTGEEWRPTVTADGARITLQAPRSGVFVPGRAYDVTGSVLDAVGNATDIHFTYHAIDGDE